MSDAGATGAKDSGYEETDSAVFESFAVEGEEGFWDTETVDCAGDE